MRGDRDRRGRQLNESMAQLSWSTTSRASPKNDGEHGSTQCHIHPPGRFPCSLSAFLFAFAFRRSLRVFGLALFFPSLDVGVTLVSLRRSISRASLARSREAPTSFPRRRSSTAIWSSAVNPARSWALSVASLCSCVRLARLRLMRDLLTKHLQHLYLQPVSILPHVAAILHKKVKKVSHLSAGA